MIGPEHQIRQLGTRLELDIADLEIFAAADDADAARKCVALCQSGRARAIMKGSLETAVLMHEVVSAEAGMRTGRRISHVFLLDVPSYPRPLLITDAAIVVVPEMESGNMLVKQLEYLGGAEPAGVVVGARVPIILTSRSDSARARLASCAVAAIIVNSTPRPDAKKDGFD